MNIFLRLYDFLHRHTALRRILLFCLTAVLLAGVLRLHFKEDIADFLPLDKEQQACMQLYQDLSESDRIVIIFQLRDTAQTSPDRLADAIDTYRTSLEEKHPELLPHLTTQIDYERYFSLMEHLCLHIPYFLNESYYLRIDSLLQDSGYIQQQIAKRKQQLQLPLSGFLSQQIVCDPLDLFAGPLQGLRQSAQTLGAFSAYDGYMITADRQQAFAFLSSPYGMSETQRNTRLVNRLTETAKQVEQTMPDISIRLNGAPVVAVENAAQIKKDSLIAISLSLLLILALLLRTFRRKRDLLLILLSVGFGWLTGMGVIGVLRGSISLIVLGISSVMIGIAVNYPLHLLVHRQHTATTRDTLRETLSPLIIGNITTVGAFLTLVPLQATALRDLGIFSAAMLIGTIVFSVVFLPHLLKDRPYTVTPRQQSSWLLRLAAFEPDKSKPLVIVCLLLTVVFGLFCLQTRFDTDISHLNYMTRQQRADFNRFAQMAGQRQGTEIWLVSEGTDWSEAVLQSERHSTVTDSLLRQGILLQERSVRQYIPSRPMQELRLARWNRFIAEHKTDITEQLSEAATAEGFRTDAFHPFMQLLDSEWQIQDLTFFLPLAETFFHGYWKADSCCFVIADRLIADAADVQTVENAFADSRCFDMASLNAQVAVSLSDSFNYIGLACSLIVFLFLWIAFRKFTVALIAFLPMAVSWLWILGIMSLTGVGFNIVNIILATFIFGQGDDYTIFITEGILYERKYGRPMLPQYKNGILLSALIMFTGIGVLVIARHPAMHSLGAVTLIGMSAVVLMAFLLPPLLFRLADRLSRNRKK